MPDTYDIHGVVVRKEKHKIKDEEQARILDRGMKDKDVRVLVRSLNDATKKLETTFGGLSQT